MSLRDTLFLTSDDVPFLKFWRRAYSGRMEAGRVRPYSKVFAKHYNPWQTFVLKYRYYCHQRLSLSEILTEKCEQHRTSATRAGQEHWYYCTWRQPYTLTSQLRFCIFITMTASIRRVFITNQFLFYFFLYFLRTAIMYGHRPSGETDTVF